MDVSLTNEGARTLDPTAGTPGANPPGRARADASGASGPSFADVLRGLGQQIGQGEAAVRGLLDAARGVELGPAARLIALQAGVYQYSEAVDLASRLVDRTTSSVKTVVQAGGQ